jgi:hypothetical protein
MACPVWEKPLDRSRDEMIADCAAAEARRRHKVAASIEIEATVVEPEFPQRALPEPGA